MRMHKSSHPLHIFLVVLKLNLCQSYKVKKQNLIVFLICVCLTMRAHTFSQVFIFIIIFIGVQLIYNIVLVSGVQQSESVIHIHMFPYLFPLASPSLPPSPSHPSRWSQSMELITLCYAAASHQLSILHLVVYICT